MFAYGCDDLRTGVLTFFPEDNGSNCFNMGINVFESQPAKISAVNIVVLNQTNFSLECNLLPLRTLITLLNSTLQWYKCMPCLVCPYGCILFIS